MAERRVGRLRVGAGRLGSVRARATLVSVLVVGAALAAGAFGLLSLLHASLQEGIETTAQSQIANVGAFLRVGQLPSDLPASRGDIFTQVVGPDGRVLATSATLLAGKPISRLHPNEDGTIIATVPDLSDVSQGRGSSRHEGPYLLVARTFPRPAGIASVNGPVTVYVAGSLKSVVEATTTVGLALAGGLPVLVALVGLLVWTFAGRALRPVEAIRSEVADITARDLHRRVPQPESGDEVARLARTMNEMLDRLESSATAQTRFVADASHELRSPLAGLQATLELALTHPDTSAWRGAASDALEEAARLHRLVEDLLALARAEQGSAKRTAQRVDLDEIIFREGQRRRAGRVALDLRRVSGGRVEGDPDQLASVVRNLLDNAQRHAASKVIVELATTEDETVALSVTDDGPGIPPADRERIFEPFARLDEARNQDEGGSGLGLAIAKEIITAHGGTIEVVEHTCGARFEVRLRAAQEPAETWQTARP